MLRDRGAESVATAGTLGSRATVHAECNTRVFAGLRSYQLKSNLRDLKYLPKGSVDLDLCHCPSDLLERHHRQKSDPKLTGRVVHIWGKE